MNKLFETVFGSHLYGTNSETSDKDFKGVFKPELNDLILQNKCNVLIEKTKDIQGAKNTPDDVDKETYSLHYFLELAFDGQTVAIDMLHSPKEFWLHSTTEWEFLYQNRSKFYTKNLKALLGYCKTQAAKYGIKGSRLSDIETILKILKENAGKRLRDIWDILPILENAKKYDKADHPGDVRCYDVCSRKLMADTPVEYCIQTLEIFYNNYGARAQQAKANMGIDWKAVSHAFRAGHQLREILLTGDLKFPLEEAKFLTDIKYGKFHYQNDNISGQLEDLLEEVTVLSDKSQYPKSVDKKFFKDWLVSLYDK